jgi:cyanophycinase
MKHWTLLLCAALTGTPALAAKTTFTYLRVGNTTDATHVTLQGGVALMGGYADVDPAFQWLCNRSSGGDFLVLRATGTDDYNTYVQQLCPNANSVATLILPSRRAAMEPGAAALIRQAETLFIAGGDQSNYINDWTGTPVQTALQERIDAGAPVGGISAGLNVLTQFVYSALGSKGVTSSQALADPYNRYLTLARDFLQVDNLGAVLGDAHFSARDRMGRDLAFLCRLYQAGWSTQPRVIAVDEETALVVDAGGEATVMGPGAVYFEQAPGAPEVCAPETPLTYRNVAIYRVKAGGSYHLPSWSGSGGTAYAVSAESGVLTSTQPGGSAY